MEYKMDKCSRIKLENFGFHYNDLLSNSAETFYTHRFTVYKYRGIPLIEAEIAVRLEDGWTNIDVFDRKSRSRYASWYCRGTLGYDARNIVVESIDEKINHKLERFHIWEVNE